MTGLVRKATLLTACGLLGAAAAMAGVPSAGNSTINPGAPVGQNTYFTVVGTEDSVGTKVSAHFNDYATRGRSIVQIVVRDLANNPIQNSSVLLDFTNCTDVKLCNDVFPGQTVTCAPTKGVRAFTNASGVAQMIVVGGANNTTASPGATGDCVQVFADGVPLGTMRAAAVDQNGGLGGASNGVSGLDLSLWFSDFTNLISPYKSRSDYTYSGSLDGLDQSFWFAMFLDGPGPAIGSVSGCPANVYCP